MGRRDSYAPGTFCWADLSTPDPVGAAAFYGALLGWRGEEMPAGDAGTYWMMGRDGGDVAGMMAMPEERRAAGAPPAWLSYVAVEDADAAAGRVTELGGTVMMPAFDVLEAGRMALVQDPQGAVLGLWEPRASIGATLVNDTGAMVINQLNTTDPEAAARFYTDLFGWSVRKVADVPQAYWGIDNAGALNGGLTGLHPGAPAPPHWLVYFTSPGLEESARVIAREGGAVVVPAMPVPGGRILVARDPQGAHFALFEGEVDP